VSDADVSRPKILVVDDEALVRLDLASALSDAGFDVLEVGNPDDALAVLSASDEIAVLITDVELFNHFDGVALAWAVRRQWPPIHIVVVSGRHRANEVELPERSRFFVKPYNVQRVIDAVTEMLAGSPVSQ
jgi:DNA-binding NtrC family response regulator